MVWEPVESRGEPWRGGGADYTVDVPPLVGALPAVSETLSTVTLPAFFSCRRTVTACRARQRVRNAK